MHSPSPVPSVKASPSPIAIASPVPEPVECEAESSAKAEVYLSARSVQFDCKSGRSVEVATSRLLGAHDLSVDGKPLNEKVDANDLVTAVHIEMIEPSARDKDGNVICVMKSRHIHLVPLQAGQGEAMEKDKIAIVITAASAKAVTASASMVSSVALVKAAPELQENEGKEVESPKDQDSVEKGPKYCVVEIKPLKPKCMKAE